MERREVSSRSNGAIRAVAGALVRSAITPNQISVFSVIASAMVPLGLLAVQGWLGCLLAVAGIQLRLLANVIDGLVAVEGGKSSPVGALYNEFPDRIADSVIFVAMGYAAGQPSLGWLCALLAALTAYVRVFGGAMGLAQSFSGPMAKQHRMAVATVTLLAAQALPAWLPAPTWSAFGLTLIAAGSALTCVTRTRGIVQQLQDKASA
jgi:phosphatidylglycerophosphate synthase